MKGEFAPNHAAIRNGSDSVMCGALQETPWDGYPQRTEWNVRDSDATLILTRGEPERGTFLALRLAQAKQKPCLVVDLEKEVEVDGIRIWVEENHINTLNIAGPRESSAPDIQAEATEVLRGLIGQHSQTNANDSEE